MQQLLVTQRAGACARVIGGRLKLSERPAGGQPALTGRCPRDCELDCPGQADGRGALVQQLLIRRPARACVRGISGGLQSQSALLVMYQRRQVGVLWDKAA